MAHSCVDNIITTPHLGASTEEAQEAVAVEAADIITAILVNNEVRHAINMAPISGTELQESKAYLDLGYRLGLLHARGDGVERNMVETFAWWKMASVNGHIRARWELKKIGDYLDLKQFAAARRLIHEREATAVVYR